MKVEISNQKGTLSERLFISKQREEELLQIISDAYESTDTYLDAIGLILPKSITDNEAFYCIFHLAAFAGSEKRNEELREFING